MPENDDASDLIDEISLKLDTASLHSDNSEREIISKPGANAVNSLNRKTKIGNVPLYLKNRKREWALEEEQRLAKLSDEKYVAL